MHKSYRYIEVKPLADVLGAEITAPELLTLDADQRAEVVAEIRDVWLERHLIVFRDLDLAPAEQAQVCELFGTLDTYPFIQATREHPNVIPIIKEPTQSANFGGAWHTDTSYMSRPPMATCLYAREVPPDGGDTLFANTRLAYQALSSGMKDLLQGLVGVFTPSMVHGSTGAYADVRHSDQSKAAPDVVDQRVSHPVVRTHPETGQKSIYATPVHCEHFDHMSRAESLPLLNYLYEHCTAERFTARLRWAEGTLALWDNRCLFHNALNDYQGHRREMHRVTLQGEVPA